jgi:hypothetical protein
VYRCVRGEEERESGGGAWIGGGKLALGLQLGSRELFIGGGE